jgi:type I restriction enzyme, R subunit
MSEIGQLERETQNRVIELFREQLGYDYLGNWIDRKNTRNVEEKWLRPFLQSRGYDEALIARALFEFQKTATDQSQSLYDINRAVYEKLRYGVKVRVEVGENTKSSASSRCIASETGNDSFRFKASAATAKGRKEKANALTKT